MTCFISEEDGININHVIPSKYSLSTIQGKVACTEPGCKMTFSLLQNLELHIIQTHQHKKFKAKEKYGEQRFYCPGEECAYQYNPDGKTKYFKKQKYLKQHYLKVHADKTLPCDLCDQSFSCIAFLTAHRVSCGKHIACSCGKTFGSISSLQTHARRLHHEANILPPNGKKRKSTTESLDALPVSPKRMPTSTPTVQIQPKTQCSHITAAIALSELAVARFKRISTVDIGVQTEVSPHKRSTKRLSVSAKEFSGIAKLRQTAETETQTNLTNLKKKNRQSRKMRSISTSSAPFDCTADKRVQKCRAMQKLSQSDVAGVPRKVNRSHKFRDAEIQCKDITTGNANMQTSPIGYACKDLGTFSVIQGSNIDLSTSPPQNVGEFSDGGENFCGIVPLPVQDGYQINNPCSNVMEIGNTNICSYINTAAIEENDQLLEKSNPTFSNMSEYSMSSSSMQTTTEQDVFLTSSLGNTCGGLITAETQTDSCNLWCSSETQTCEDFAEIEQYLCSTIHTQTAESPDDLFPDLNFMDTYTQTGVNDLADFDPFLE